MDIEQMRIRMGEMAAEIERKQSIIDEANAQKSRVYCSNNTIVLDAVKNHFGIRSDKEQDSRTAFYDWAHSKDLPLDSIWSSDGEPFENSDTQACWEIWQAAQNAITIPAQQSPAVAVPDLDSVDGDILPPVGASVAIHLGSCDKWVNHTVVGYYAWGPLGGIDSAYSRVFVRVVDDQGILNARLLKDVMWDKNIPIRALASQWSERITEREFREIITDFLRYIYEVRVPSVESWFNDMGGRALLNKLNDKHESN